MSIHTTYEHRDIFAPLVTLHIEKPSKINPLPMIGKFDANEVKEYEKLV